MYKLCRKCTIESNKIGYFDIFLKYINPYANKAPGKIIPI